MTLRVDKLLPWREIETMTSRGVVRARIASPTSAFWGQWREHKAELKAAGIRVVKNPHSGRYVVYWYEPRPVPTEHWSDVA